MASIIAAESSLRQGARARGKGQGTWDKDERLPFDPVLKNDVLGSGRGYDSLDGFPNHIAQVKALNPQFQPIRFDLAQVENVVDQFEKMDGVAMNVTRETLLRFV